MSVTFFEPNFSGTNSDQPRKQCTLTPYSEDYEDPLSRIPATSPQMNPNDLSPPSSSSFVRRVSFETISAGTSGGGHEMRQHANPSPLSSAPITAQKHELTNYFNLFSLVRNQSTKERFIQACTVRPRSIVGGSDNRCVSVSARHPEFHSCGASRIYMVAFSDDIKDTYNAVNWLLHSLVKDGDEIICVKHCTEEELAANSVNSQPVFHKEYFDGHDSPHQKHKHSISANSLPSFWRNRELPTPPYFSTPHFETPSTDPHPTHTSAQGILSNILEIVESSLKVSVTVELAIGKVKSVVKNSLQMYQPCLVVITSEAVKSSSRSKHNHSMSSYLASKSPVPLIVVTPLMTKNAVSNEPYNPHHTNQLSPVSSSSISTCDRYARRGSRNSSISTTTSMTTTTSCSTSSTSIIKDPVSRKGPPNPSRSKSIVTSTSGISGPRDRLSFFPRLGAFLDGAGNEGRRHSHSC